MNVMLRQGKRWILTGLFFFMACLCVATSHGTDVTMAIYWGVQPFINAYFNGTVFRTESGTEMSVADFNMDYSMRLAFVGDGSFDEESGYASMRWIGTPLQAVSVGPGATYTGSFEIDGTTGLPITWLGDIDKVDPNGELYADEDKYYAPLWHAANFATVVYSPVSKRAWRLSETPKGQNPVGVSAFTSMVTVDPWQDLHANELNLVNTLSKSVYIGAEIPQKCVWMADKGLSATNLVGYDEGTIERAMALDKVPAEVAGGVELKIGSISLDPQAGTATLAFQFTATDETGESGGARLLLETASSAGDLGTENASKQEVSLSSSSVTIPTSGEAFFARLVLDTP